MEADKVVVRIGEDAGGLFAELFTPGPILEWVKWVAEFHPDHDRAEAARDFLRKWGLDD